MRPTSFSLPLRLTARAEQARCSPTARQARPAPGSWTAGWIVLFLFLVGAAVVYFAFEALPALGGSLNM